MKNSVGVTQYPKMIVTFFAAIIIIGAALLALPVSSVSGAPTPLIDALFTATSASCVTGLVVYDTYTHWSPFGQGVILVLVQIGGIGFMSVVAFFSLLLRRRIGLNERILLMEASGSSTLRGVVRLTKRILYGTLLFEGVGCVLLAMRFCARMGLKEGLWNAVFHSISAFCNAGFDLMGKYKGSPSFSAFSGDPLVVAVVTVLIVAGSIGFLIWDDVLTCKWRWSKFSLHTKIVLSTTATLIFGGAVFFCFTEAHGAMRGMSAAGRLAGALAHSVSLRTAGFAFVDVSALSAAGMFLTVVLMVIGGSPCSAAGGIKTTTVFTLLAATRATLGNKKHITAFNRQIEDSALRRACSIIVIYLLTALSGIVLVGALESLPIAQVVFEVASAAGTVGISMGVTPLLGAPAKFVFVCLMYFGRAGILSIVFTFAKERPPEQLQLPKEQIIIG